MTRDVHRTEHSDAAVPLVRRIGEAQEAGAEALARAKGARAELDDTGETRGDHEEARDAHLRAAHTYAEIADTSHAAGDYETGMDQNCAAARHRAAAAAHEFARMLGEASASDPREDGSGIELGSRATIAALRASQRALQATKTPT